MAKQSRLNNNSRAKAGFKPMGRRTNAEHFPDLTMDDLGGMMKPCHDLNGDDLIVYSVPRFAAREGMDGNEFIFRPQLSTFETRSFRVGDKTVPLPRLFAIVREGSEGRDLGELLTAVALGHTVPDAFADSHLYEMGSGIVMRPLVMQGGEVR